MRLRRLDCTRYGKFTGSSIDFGEMREGAPDLHIVYGPNEAGKSTAFSAFLDLLFGIEPQSRYGFLHPYPAMRIGACLELSVGARELVRVKRAPTLRDDLDQAVAEGLILGELGGLDRNSYRTMFSLDDDTLEAGGKSILASHGELGQLLFSASAGLAELSQALVGLRADADGFYKPRAHGSELAVLKGALAALNSEREGIDTLASEYNRLKAARETAAAQYHQAVSERAAAKSGLDRVERLLLALPHLAAVRSLRERREGFDSVPEAPAGWSAALPELQRAEIESHTRMAQAAAEVARLGGALEAIVVDQRALGLAANLDGLRTLRARFETAALDLPVRGRELDRAVIERDGLLQRLGRAGEADPRRLLLDAAQTAALRTLIETRSGIDKEVATAGDEHAAAVQELDLAKQALHAAGGELGTQGWDVALALYRDSDHAVRARNALRERARQVDRLAEVLADLAPWSGTVEELAGLRTPDPDVVKGWDRALVRAEALVERRRTDAERIAGELVERGAALAAIGDIAGLVNDSEAAAIRSAREAAWAEHRRLLEGGSADAFEAALRRDDMVGSARLGHERDLARLHKLAEEVATKRAEAEHAGTLLEAAIAERRAEAERMAAAIAGVSPLLPPATAELLRWLERRGQALDLWRQVRQCERDLAAAETDRLAIRQRLANLLAAAAMPFEAGAGEEVLAGMVRDGIDRAARRQVLRAAVADQERALARREAALQRAARADKGWQAAWREACSGCWLAEKDFGYQAMREILAALAALGPMLRAEAGLVDRIASMAEDQRLFREEVDRLAGMLGLDGPGTPIERARQIEDRIEAAERARDARLRTAADLAAAQDSERAIAAAAALQRERAGEMKRFFQVETLLEVSGKLRDAGEKAELSRQIAEAEREIVAGLDAASVASAEAMLDAAPSVADLQLERSALAADYENLDQRLRDRFAASRLAEDKIEAVGGDDAAARIEQRRRTTLLEIEDKASRYLRLRLGLAAADRALRAYRDQHQSAMMRQASDAFALITAGAYRSLGSQADKDGEMLIAVGADGGSKMATDLSKGTRFQLYLALRAAGYREFARLRRPVPFIADDIMETFDDLRAEEALRLFGDMAMVGQVIYLTHHEHLCRIAERTIPRVKIHHLGREGK